MIDWCNMGYIYLWLLFLWPLFLIVFVPINCFKLVFLLKVIMGCKLLNISLKLLPMLSMPVLVYYFPWLYLNENGIVSLLYVWIYNVSKVMIYLCGQLSQFFFLQSVHCSSFQQIFLLSFDNVSCIPRGLNKCV